jgi:hypothetical protein
MGIEDYQFEKGREKTAGRKVGARNRLSHAFLEAFAADFEAHGAEIIKIVRIEKPHEYLRTAAYLMPKEFTGEAALTVRTIVTGVVRAGDIDHYPNGPPQIPAAVPMPVLPEDDDD